jgi:hypothetical protein
MWIIVVRFPSGELRALTTADDTGALATFSTPDEAYRVMVYHLLGALPYEVIEVSV